MKCPISTSVVGFSLIVLTVFAAPAGAQDAKSPPAKAGEICASPFVPSRPCVPGFQCINKRPELADYPGKCYKAGEVTVAVEGEGCEPSTYSRCADGLLCEKPPKKSVKVCMRPRTPFIPSR